MYGQDDGRATAKLLFKPLLAGFHDVLVQCVTSHSRILVLLRGLLYRDKLPENTVALLVFAVTQQMYTVTSCMQISPFHLPACAEFYHRPHLDPGLDQIAIPPFSSSPATQELQHLLTPLPTPIPEQERCNLSLHLCGCSPKLFLEGSLVTLSKAIERLWILLLKREVFHSGARTLSRGALTVVKPLLEE